MKTILIIDDSPTIRTSVDYAIRQLGHPTKQAENGKKGLVAAGEIIKNGDEIILVIVDINMPEMDGVTFIREFRKTDRFTPILVLTTESEEEKIKEGKAAGASGWMMKPFRPNDLVSVVQKIIR